MGSSEQAHVLRTLHRLLVMRGAGGVPLHVASSRCSGCRRVRPPVEQQSSGFGATDVHQTRAKNGQRRGDCATGKPRQGSGRKTSVTKALKAMIPILS
mmetsp:Transcript_50603/g.105332  ORF Transcript_50603/g.105332 Transcript_50603/m.105332 type:complete len:98 (+) Transcript_50603:127-420(+)